MLTGLFAPSFSITDGLSDLFFVGEGAEVLTSRVARGFVGEGEDIVRWSGNVRL